MSKRSIVFLALVVFVACSRTPPQSPGPGETAAAPQQSTPSDQGPVTSAAPPEANAPAVSPNAASAPQAPADESPAFREVTIPAGTPLGVRLITPIASDRSKVEDQVRGALVKPIVVRGVTAVPAGAELVGFVVSARQSGRVKGRASVAFRFERLIVGNEGHDIRTALVAREAAHSTRDDLAKGAIGAGAGAIVGGLLGGGKGAAIGAGVGGTGGVLVRRGAEVRLPAGTTVRAILENAVHVLVPQQK